MSKREDKVEPLGLKLNLDIEELKPKYDKIFPEVSRALDHVHSPQARGQLECLLSDVYDTFLQPELKQPKGKQPSQFLEMIKKFLQDPSSAKKKNVFDAIKLKQVNLTAVSKLKQAKAIQKQVEDLDSYFEDILASLPEYESSDQSTSRTSSGKQRCRSTSTNRARPVPVDTSGTGGTTTTMAAENKTGHCIHGSDMDSSEALRSFQTAPEIDSVVDIQTLPLSLDSAGQSKTAENSGAVEKPRPAGETDSSCIDTIGEGGEGHGLCSPTGRRARSKRSCAQEMRKIWWMAEGAKEFQLNLPPRHLRESSTLVVKSKAGMGEGPNPCRKAVDSFDGNPTVEFTKDGIAGRPPCRSALFGSNSDSGDRNFEREKDKTSLNFEIALKSYRGGKSVWSSQRDSGSGSAHTKPALSRIDGLVESVQSLGFSLQERRMRVDALKKSNAILEEQIAEVESTVESFDNYLNSVRSKPHPVLPEALKREMYALQEVMIEKIFACVETLSTQMKALRKTEQAKEAKVKAMLAKYDATKKETPEALLVFHGVEAAAASSSFPQRALPAKATGTANNELARGLRAVVTAIEFFHASCEDIWDETMERVFSELETLIASLPSPPSKRWSPDDPGSSTSLSLSSLETLEDDVKIAKTLPEDKSKYGTVIVFSLRMLERVCSELGHLMVVTRIKDLQMISIDHSIGLAYMSMKQMMAPALKKTKTVQNRSKEKNKLWKPGMKDKRRKAPVTSKAKKSEEVKLNPSELAPHEKRLEKRLNTNVNVDKRLLRHRVYDGRTAPSGERAANQGVLAGQLAADNAQHMGAAADMRLPLIQLDDPSLPPAEGAPTSHSNGLGPWTHVTAAAPAAAVADSTTMSKTNRASEAPNPKSKRPPKSRTNLPKIIAPAQKTRNAPAAASSTGTTEKPEQTSGSGARNATFVQHRMVLLNEDGEPVDDTMDNAMEEKKKGHRPIQYCRVLAMPTPPSANLITEEKEPAEEKTATKSPRKLRWRQPSHDTRKAP